RASTVIEGLIARRAALYRETSFYKVTNYDVIHRDLDAIAGWAPDLIILDEAQRIKNWKTRAAQSVKQLNSKYALVLTGTPLENRLEELHSIVEFVDCFHLGPLFQFLADHQTVDEDGKVVGYRNLSKIAVTLEPIMMRRTRDEVLKELPKRLDKNYFVPMTPEQSKYHAENQETVARIVQKWRRMHFLSETDQLRMRIALQNMRMSCNSTYLLDQETDFGVKADEFVSVLKELLEQPETKVVVFSQWRRTHELLCKRLETMGEKFVLFHGQIPGPKRKDPIKRFKTDPEHKIFLSTDAGGVGLNLQNASVVINMDLPWNPAVLEQRIGRVHRLGQSRPVRVINFVSKGTIEEGMLSVLSFKKSLFAGVLDNGQDEVFLGGSRLKQFMETVEKTTGSIPDPMPSHAQTPDLVETKEAEPKTDSAEEAWNDLLSTGLSFLEGLGRSLTQNKKTVGETPVVSSPSLLKLETDARTGERCLKVPIPSKEVVTGIANLLGDLAKRLQ
ncbi:MAG: DEAD/DEAH box helicase, partial [Planctomycetes bacterium]|nr:DEAD/DEAH box helicase [Planctomycetota bacterium]